MKFILVGLLLAIATITNAAVTNVAVSNGAVTNAPPQTKQLQCGDPNSFRHFTATLDYSYFDAASGLFDVTDAYAAAGYALADLKCAGHKLSELTCIGFWFNEQDFIVEVKVTTTTTQTHGDEITYSQSNLTKAPIANVASIPCTLK